MREEGVQRERRVIFTAESWSFYRGTQKQALREQQKYQFDLAVSEREELKGTDTDREKKVFF